MLINDVVVEENELEQLIDLIAGISFRKYFQKYPNEFSKMKKGFRPESLTEEMAVQLAKKNMDNPFIISYVEKRVRKWIDEIDEYKSRLLSRGATDGGALFFTLQQSVFADNLDIYFKFAKSNYSDSFIEEFKSAVVSYGVPFDLLSEENTHANLPAAVERELKDTEEELFEAKRSLQRLEEVIENEKREKEDLIKRLDEAVVQNKELSGRLTEIENLSTYDDKETVDRTKEFPYVSVCQVFKDYNGQLWLSRIADITDNLELIRFRKDDGALPFFTNRDRLFHRDGLDYEGAIGVWRWNAIPNKSNPESDYVTTAFCNEIALTEVVVISEVKTIKELSDALLEGVQVTTHFSKVLFAYRIENDCFEGLLCRERDWTSVNGIVKVKKDVVILPQYRIYGDDILRIEGIEIIAHVGMGTPTSIFKTMDPYTVVKEILLKRLTIPYLRTQGLNRKEAQTYQQFLREIVSEDIYEEMSEKYSCSQEDAKYYVDKFVEVSERYLNANEIEIDLLSRSIRRLPDIVDLAKSVLRNEWVEENAEEINKKNIELQEISSKIESKQQELSMMNNKLNQISDDIAAKEKLTLSVEKEVAKRIKDAQQSIAELVVNAALITPMLNLPEMGAKQQIHESSKEVFALPIVTQDIDEVIEEISIFEDELAENLIKMGYSTDGAIDIAQIASFCISEKIPMICSSNSVAVAISVAATFGEKEVLVVDVPINDHMRVIDNLALGENNHKVVLIQGAFDSFGANVFNTIMTRLYAWKRDVLFVLSIDGIDPVDIPVSVWNRSFYVDGDVDLKCTPHGVLSLFNCNISFTRNCDDNNRQKELKSYAPILDNQAIIRYARFMKNTDSELRQSVPILNQLSIRAKATGKADMLNDKLAEESIAQKVLERIKLLN